MPRLGLARIKTDPEYMGGKTRMDLKDWPKGFSNPGYPQVIQLWRTPKGGEDKVPLSPEWVDFLEELNTVNGMPTNQAHPYKVIKEVAYCFFNERGDKRWHAENIVFGDQIVNVLEIKKGSARIETLYYKDKPPDKNKVSYDKTPWLVHRVTAIYKNKIVNFQGTKINTAYNEDFIFVISRHREGVWIPVEKLDFEHIKPLYEKERIDLPEEPEMPDDRAIGIDVSAYMGDIDWEKVKAAGIKYCFIRTLHGLSIDKRHDEYVEEALRVGIPIVGEYHFIIAEESIKKQAQLFADLYSEKSKFAVVDVEDTQEETLTNAQVKLYVDTLAELLPDTEIMIYTSKSKWQANTGNAAWGSAYPLWVANWTTKEAPAMPIGWKSWDFWQYNNKGIVDGIKASPDMNRFKGTEAELHEYLNFEPPPPIPTLDERLVVVENKTEDHEVRIKALEEKANE